MSLVLVRITPPKRHTHTKKKKTLKTIVNSTHTHTKVIGEFKVWFSRLARNSPHSWTNKNFKKKKNADDHAAIKI